MSGLSSRPKFKQPLPTIRLSAAIATRVLERHFRESLHPDILNAVGLTLETTVTRRKRDPAFRQRFLKAYDYRCAVCDFRRSARLSVDRLGRRPLPLAPGGGPESESNGFAICVLHHNSFGPHDSYEPHRAVTLKRRVRDESPHSLHQVIQQGD